MRPIFRLSTRSTRGGRQLPRHSARPLLVSSKPGRMPCRSRCASAPTSMLVQISPTTCAHPPLYPVTPRGPVPALRPSRPRGTDARPTQAVFHILVGEFRRKNSLAIDGGGMLVLRGAMTGSTALTFPIER
eukprot:scaffold124398_cov30-Tisochrysis_lutea.AAC.3